MVKRLQIPMYGRYMHFNPASLQKIGVLQIIAETPTIAWWPNHLQTDSPYAAYVEVDAIYAVIELLSVPVSDPKLSTYRLKARLAIEEHLEAKHLK